MDFSSNVIIQRRSAIIERDAEVAANCALLALTKNAKPREVRFLPAFLHRLISLLSSVTFPKGEKK